MKLLAFLLKEGRWGRDCQIRDLQEGRDREGGGASSQNAPRPHPLRAPPLQAPPPQTARRRPAANGRLAATARLQITVRHSRSACVVRPEPVWDPRGTRLGSPGPGSLGLERARSCWLGRGPGSLHPLQFPSTFRTRVTLCRLIR